MVEEANQGSLAMTPIRETQAEKGALLTVPKIAPPGPYPKGQKRIEAQRGSGSKQFGEYNYNCTIMHE